MTVLDYIFIGDLLGYIGVLFSTLGFSSTKRNTMLVYGLISTLCFGISIYCYGGTNGLFVSFFSAFLKIMGIYHSNHITKRMTVISPFIALGFFTLSNNEGLVGALPAISLVFISLADMQSNIIKMKYIYFGSVFCWLTYGIALGSIPAILFDVVGAISLIVGIVKTYSLEKEKV